MWGLPPQPTPITTFPQQTTTLIKDQTTPSAHNMEKVIGTLIAVVGIIHLMPVTGVIGNEQLATLYGILINEPNLEILMRHRAVLFGLLGVFLLVAAFRPALRTLAIIAGFVSVTSFIAIAWSVGGYNDAVNRVVIADIIAIVALIAAGVLQVRDKTHSLATKT